MSSICLAQINPFLGDCTANAKMILAALKKAKVSGAKLVVFPELCIIGYPPKDLLQDDFFIEQNRKALERILPFTKGMAAVIGFVDKKYGNIYNAAAVVSDGKIVGVQHKTHLPNYGVFDEKRYFAEAQSWRIFSLAGERVAITICEDIWVEPSPLAVLAKQGATLCVNLSASPFEKEKMTQRKNILINHARKFHLPLVYVNMVGGQDDLVFDGRSCVVNAEGKVIAQARAFSEDLLMADLQSQPVCLMENAIQDMHDALVLALRDYVHKNGFSSVVVGVSGGIDSAVTASLAVEALGKKNVVGVFMPSSFTSGQSAADAKVLASNLGIPLRVISIQQMYNEYKKLLRIKEPHTALENIQARIRGNILMAFSNAEGHLVVTTGNKSEIACGYCTLYGDTAGGFALLSDVYKTSVYKLAAYINRLRQLIPSSIIAREPTAELRHNQKDTDSLPPYDVLDRILHALFEEGKSQAETVALGFPKAVVSKVADAVRRSEYKRHQLPPGPKVSSKAFGSGRRFPITNGDIEKLFSVF
ncbi:NAD+ synthase [Candidatus Woesearchaeota archaeon]|nr:NAD+ synthase [Candidatus Woesearchaeota archaeon]